MADLKTRVEELRAENDYQLRLKDMTYNEKIKELTEKFVQEMESLKTKNQARSFLFLNLQYCQYIVLNGTVADQWWTGKAC